MANEVTVPLLPCGSIDEVADFYGMLGFDRTYRQTKPNPYVVLRREDIQLHFFGLRDFEPEQSYGSCIVRAPDTAALYQSFAEGMRAVHGKLLVSGIPRMTRPRKRKNTGSASGFTVVDTGGNWIRIFAAPDDQPGATDQLGATGQPEGTDQAQVADQSPVASRGKLAKALENAIVLGESKGDHRQAARILDTNLAREDDTMTTVDIVEAHVYRAELALALADHARADEVLAQVRGMTLGDTERARLVDALANAAELERVLGDSPFGRR